MIWGSVWSLLNADQAEFNKYVTENIEKKGTTGCSIAEA